MNTVKAFAKFLDQPRLVGNFSRTLPPLLALSAGAMVIQDTYNTPKDERKKVFIRNGLTMFGAVASSIYAPKITAGIFRTAPEVVKPDKLNKYNSKLINDFLAKNKVNSKTEKLLHKTKTKILNVREVKHLSENLHTSDGRALFNNLIPEPENISSKEIFSEIGRLSVFGLIPVLGGIAGGILGDRFTDSNYRKKIPDKIKEGAYQYLANIFLCNIGAGAALCILEKLNIKSKAARALGMVSGIVLTGVIGGSAIANFIGKKVINKCFKDSDTKERKPEVLDICLHSDDIATVAVMSGLRWIEPALPALYSISGYRAGTGYGGKKKNDLDNNPDGSDFAMQEDQKQIRKLKHM